MFPKPQVALVALAALVSVGCQPAHSRLLGAEQAGAVPSSVGTLKTATTPITLTGTMTEKCPTAGCWFRLKDQTGTVKIQLASASFTVTDIPTGAPVQVSGRYNKESGEVEASGVRW